VWCKLKLLQIESRQKIDNAIFTFGTYESEGEHGFGYKVFCAGSDSHSLEWFMPLKGDRLNDLVNSLKRLNGCNFRKKIKIKSGWSNINLHFLGLKPDKGIKIKTNISGFLFYSSAFGSSYLSQIVLYQLITNLERCMFD
jgi:hypothetical protein